MMNESVRHGRAGLAITSRPIRLIVLYAEESRRASSLRANDNGRSRTYSLHACDDFVFSGLRARFFPRQTSRRRRRHECLIKSSPRLECPQSGGLLLVPL